MGAPITIDGCDDLWVSNGAKDLFCEIVVRAAALQGRDISGVLTAETGLGGAYGATGMGVDVKEFYACFGGRIAFRRHLDFCSSQIEQLCDHNAQATATMARVFAWATYLMDGSAVAPGQHDFHTTWPPRACP